jgi:hypothetical protein
MPSHRQATSNPTAQASFRYTADAWMALALQVAATPPYIVAVAPASLSREPLGKPQQRRGR